MNGKELAQTAQINTQKINSLAQEKEAIEKASTSEQYRLKWDVYQDKIRALEKERDTAIEQVKSKAEIEAENKTSQINMLYEPIAQVKRILQLLRLKPKTLTQVDPEKVKVRDTHWRNNKQPYKEDLGYFVNEEFLNIKLFIVTNEKPTNCYSLIAYGYCLFYDNDNRIMKVPHGYVQGAYYSDGYPNIEAIIRESPNTEDLKTWLGKNRSKILAEFITNYEAVKAEYLAVLKNYKVEDFEQFISLKCSNCGYFRTTFDDSYSYYSKELCPDCKKIKLTETGHKPKWE